MTVVGFDFGTTNSLVAVVAGARAIPVLDEEGLPTPSVVGYEGARVLAGQEAKARLDRAGLGVHDTLVRSPKILLGEEVVHVGGVARSPVDVVADVVEHVKHEALASRLQVDLGGVREAVVTIPVDFDGARRRGLRDAFGRAGIRIQQFIHEPFAALYGYFRSASADDALHRYRRRLVLVVDWGGGTLDLTLCLIGGSRISQVANHGTEAVGGDHFDEAIRNAVLARYYHEYEIPPDVEIHDDARIRLLRQCEQAKIELSDRSTFPLYVPSFFRSLDEDFDHQLGRTELEDITAPLIRDGIGRIRTLLDRAGVGHQQVALCLATGGMTQVPAIRTRLYELFGPNCVVASDRSATMIAEGAAWFANDRRSLSLAKNVELALARQSYVEVLRAGLEMPPEGSRVTRQLHLYCADPRDGVAKFRFTTPRRVAADVQQTEPRDSLATAAVSVDSRAKPFRERLELDVGIDDNLILTADIRSLNAKDATTVHLHNLEFAVPLPASTSASATSGPEEHVTWTTEVEHEPGSLEIRANLADNDDDRYVPGELLHELKPRYFEPALRPPQEQVEEYLYYRPCAVCGRASNDPKCRCSRGRAEAHQ